jgi:hypothetical protein
VNANAEQERFWDEEAGPAWVEHQERFDAVVGPFGRLSLDAGAPAPGESVLDVGCGTRRWRRCRRPRTTSSTPASE